MDTVTSKIPLARLVAGGKLQGVTINNYANIKGAIGALLEDAYSFLDLGAFSEFSVIVINGIVEINVPVEKGSSNFDSQKLKAAIL